MNLLAMSIIIKNIRREWKINRKVRKIEKLFVYVACLSKNIMTVALGNTSIQFILK